MAVLIRRLSFASMLSGCRTTLLMLLIPLFATPALAQNDTAALQIKAAFLHKFATYVQGEGTVFDDAEAPLVFGVAGSDEVYDFLVGLIATQGTGMRRAEVRRVNEPRELAGVHVLFVGEEAAPVADTLLQQALGDSMLTVTDLPGPQPANSMIDFFVADDRVRFDIALSPVSAAGLRLSSRLLQVARVVGD